MSSTLGSPTKTCWKRRSRAGSFSMRSRYSSSVVAPIRCSSPRASIGLSMLPASIAESPPAPAPTTVCSSSMKVMIWPSALLDLLEHGLEPLLELAAVLRAGDHRGQVEAEHAPALEGVGHVAGDHALGQPLDDGGLADAGLADQHRVVLGTPREHLHDAADLRVAADDRVELALLGALGQVDGVLLQRLVGRLGLLAGDLAVAADGGDRLAQGVLVGAEPRRAASSPGCRPRPARAAGARWRRSRRPCPSSGRATWPAPGSGRAEAPGVETVEPEALGRFHRAWSRARLTAATSAPALASSEGVMPRSWRSSATARCTGSIWGLPSVTARVLAALITSTLREVSLDASTCRSPREVRGWSWLCGSVYPNEAKVESIPLNFDEFSWRLATPLDRVDHGAPLGQSASTGARTLLEFRTVATVRTDRRTSRGGESPMLGLLAHGFHLLLVVLGLVGCRCTCSSPSCRRPRAPPGVRRSGRRRAPPSTSSASPRCAPPSWAASSPPPDQATLRSPAPAARDSSTWRGLAVGSSVAAAGAHAAVFPHHLEEAWYRRPLLPRGHARAGSLGLPGVPRRDQRPPAPGRHRRQPRPGRALGGLAHGRPAVRSRHASRSAAGTSRARSGSWSSSAPASSDCDDRKHGRALAMGDLGTRGLGLGGAVRSRPARADPDGLGSLND